MANDEHVALLKKGVKAWNAWRDENPNVRPDLSNADLSGADLAGANLREAFLFKANLGSADLVEANRRDHADLSGAVLSGADLREAFLRKANLTGADLSGADLSGADLSLAPLVSADLTDADLTGCHIYGVSAWGLKLDGTKQHNLIITKTGEPEVTTDDIEVAQFLYLLLHNQKIRRIIDTITSKVVLILGRFTPVRKPMLDALRDELRKPERGYVPVVFDFEKSRSQTTVETVTLLARMARFVIADLSDAKSVLQELQAIVPNSPKLAVQPVIISAQDEPGMFDSIEIYRSVAKTYRYDDLAQLTANLDKWVIRPAEAKVSELRGP
jgi:Pentapeptide repeats (8 copies)